MFAVLAVVAIVLAHDVPSWLDLHIQKWAQDRYKWTIVNRQSSPIFRYFFNPIADGLTWAVEHTESLLLALRWPGVVALTGAIGWRTGGLRAGLAGAAAMMGVGVIADWDNAMRTLSIMAVAVVIALVLGVPLGILAARSDRAERVIRVLLDTAQVMPIFVYFSPVQIFFGLQFAPAVVVTVIYALPPAVRLTNLGLRQVPVVANEVGQSFGATSRQQLFKVQLPIARRTILLGLNQVIMMAFAIVVLASLLGTGDLGQDVLAALQKQEVGVAFASGLGIVLMAVALDRVSTGDRNAVPSQLSRRLPKVPPHIATALAVGVPVLAVLAACLRCRTVPQQPPVRHRARHRRRGGLGAGQPAQGRAHHRWHASHQRLPGRQHHRPALRVAHRAALVAGGGVRRVRGLAQPRLATGGHRCRVSRAHRRNGFHSGWHRHHLDVGPGHEHAQPGAGGHHHQRAHRAAAGHVGGPLRPSGTCCARSSTSHR